MHPVVSIIKNRFAAQWLARRKLSAEASEVLNCARAIYKFYFAESARLRTNLFKIESWDAGWWQIKKSLTDANLATDLLRSLKTAHSALAATILPHLSKYGIIEK